MIIAYSNTIVLYTVQLLGFANSDPLHFGIPYESRRIRKDASAVVMTGERCASKQITKFNLHMIILCITKTVFITDTNDSTETAAVAQ